MLKQDDKYIKDETCKYILTAAPSVKIPKQNQVLHIWAKSSMLT